MKQQKHFFQTQTGTFFSGLMIALVLALTNLQPSYAYDNFAKGEQFGPAFVDRFNELMNGLREEKCVGKIYGQSLDFTFAGILPQNIHISQSQRQNINSIAQEWIRKRYGQNYNLSYSQEIGTATTFSYSNPEKLKKSILHHMQDAPLFLLMRTRRPFLDILQIEIVIYARSEGKSLCNRHKTIYLHLPSNKVISLHHLTAKERGVEGQYVDDSQGYLFGLEKLISDIKGLKILPFLPGFDDPVKCSWHNRETRLFQSQYFALQQKIKRQQLSYSRKDWPLFKPLIAQFGAESDALPLPSAMPDHLLSVRWSKADKTRRIVQLTLSLYEKGLLKNTVSYFIVSNDPHYPVCQPPKKEKPLELKVDRIRDRYKIGDILQFVVSANRSCELNIVYRQSDGKIILLPHYHQGKPLVGDRFLKSGETRIIPAHTDYKLRISGSKGNESLFIQCKVGGLGKSRIGQDVLDRYNNRKAGENTPFLPNIEPSEKHLYANELKTFFIE